MNTVRIQDLVARLGGVNLQSTVSVLNALYVVSKELARVDKEQFQAFKMAYEALLVASSVDSEGEVQGLRAKPSHVEAKGCYRMSKQVDKYYGRLVSKIRRDAPIELIIPVATGMLAHNKQRSAH